MNTPAIKLTEEQVQQFHREGFLGLDAITDQAELERMRVIYDKIFQERMGWEDGRQFDLGGNEQDGKAVLPQVMQPSRYFPELLETNFRKNACVVARQLLGETMYPDPGEHMIYKPAKYGGVTPWHQDQSYHDPTRIVQQVNIWMPLDDATIESGCLQYVPGSHELDVLPHHSINNDPRVHGLEVDNAESYHEQAVACPVPAGGCAMHASFMLHYAAPNTTNNPRRAYTLVFACPGVQRKTPIDNYWKREKQTAQMARTEAAKKKN